MSNLWIDYALFAQAAAEGKLPTDSASIAQAVWPEMAELKGNHWHDTLMARRSKFSPGAADSVYDADQVRLLQHILFRVSPTQCRRCEDRGRKKAEHAGAGQAGRRFRPAGVSAIGGSGQPNGDSGFLPAESKGKVRRRFR